jgi:hypothetical protein
MERGALPPIKSLQFLPPDRADSHLFTRAVEKNRFLRCREYMKEFQVDWIGGEDPRLIFIDTCAMM